MKITIMAMLPKAFGFSLTVLLASAQAVELPKPLVVDQTSPKLRATASRLWAAAFSPDGNTLAVTAGWDDPKEAGELVLWDVRIGKPKLIWRQDATIRCVAFSREGKSLAIGDFAGATRILNPQTGQVIIELPKQEKPVNSLLFMPTDASLVTGGFDETVRFWDPVSGKLLRTLNTPGEGITCVAVSPKGSSLTAVTWPGKAHVWNVPSLTQSYVLNANNAGQIAEVVVFSPDAKSLVTGSWDHSLKVWNAEQGKLLRELPGHLAPVQSAAFSPDGRILASGDASGKVRLWVAATGETIAALEGHSDRCFGLAFSPDGKRLATAAWDRKVLLWDLATRQQVATLLRETP